MYDLNGRWPYILGTCCPIKLCQHGCVHVREPLMYYTLILYFLGILVI